MSKVSVIIPCGNLGRFVGDAIRSALDQSYEDKEVIVINDASTDETSEICASFGDRIHYISNDSRQHVSRSRNIGIQHSKGEYITCLDADDMLGDMALETLVAALDNDRMLDIVYGAMEVIEDDGRIWKSGWPPVHFNYEAQLSGKDQVPTCSMYRRRVWSRVGGYRVGYERVEDALFYTQAVAIGFIPQKVTEAVTLRYRLRKDSLSHMVKEKEWHTLAPRKPQWTPYTYEPTKVQVVILTPPHLEEAAQHTIDCVWAQTLPSWECVVVLEKDSIAKYPPFVKIEHIENEDDGLQIPDPKGYARLIVNAGVHIENDFLERAYNIWQEQHQALCPYFITPEMLIKDTRWDYQCKGNDKEGSMPCGSCGGRAGATHTMPRSLASQRFSAPMGTGPIPPKEEGKVLIEYIDEGSWPIRGPVTGEFYYFSIESGHRIQSVWVSDAKQLLDRFDTRVREYKEEEKPALFTT